VGDRYGSGSIVDGGIFSGTDTVLVVSADESGSYSVKEKDAE
jgi:hypothetical protein